MLGTPVWCEIMRAHQIADKGIQIRLKLKALTVSFYRYDHVYLVAEFDRCTKTPHDLEEKKRDERSRLTLRMSVVCLPVPGIDSTVFNLFP